MLQWRASMTTSRVALMTWVSILSPPPSYSRKPVLSENVRSPVTRSWPPGSPLLFTLAVTAASMMEHSFQMEGRSLLEIERTQLAVLGSFWCLSPIPPPLLLLPLLPPHLHRKQVCYRDAQTLHCIVDALYRGKLSTL